MNAALIPRRAVVLPDAGESGDTAAHTPKVSRNTFLQDGGEIATDMMRRCTYEIAALSQQVIDSADSGLASGVYSDHTDHAYLLRAAGARIHQLNSLLMSYLCDDSMTLADAARELDRTRLGLYAELAVQGVQP